MYGSEILKTGIDPLTETPQGTLRPLATHELKFLFTSSGGTKAGESLTPADLGSLSIDFRGSTFIDASFEYFIERAKQEDGDVDEPSGTADSASERIVVYVPFYFPELPQVLNVTPDDFNFSFNFDTSTLTTKMADMSVKVEQKTADLPEVYMPYTLLDTFAIAATSGQSRTYNEPNIVKLWMQGQNSPTIDELSIEQDKETLTSNMDLEEYRDEQRYRSVASQNLSSPVYALYDALDALTDRSVLSDQTVLDIDASVAGDLEVIRQRFGVSPQGSFTEAGIEAALAG